MLISLGIGAGNGVYVGQVIKTLIFSYLSYLIYYLAIYNIAVIAVMMTGNTLVSIPKLINILNRYGTAYSRIPFK